MERKTRPLVKKLDEKTKSHLPQPWEGTKKDEFQAFRFCEFP
jgi:hypothetical protein